MKKFLNLYKINQKDEAPAILNILFDFGVVALATLIFNGYIINNNESSVDQRIFMVFAAALVSTHYYQEIVFRERYSKPKLYYRIFTFVEVATLLMMAIGIGQMAFRENNRANGNDIFNYLKWSSIIIYISGYIASRLISGVQFNIAYIANKNKYTRRLCLYKIVSRYLVTAIGISNLVLIIFGGFEIVPLLIYIYMPIYLLFELLGNILNITNKNLNNTPKISLKMTKERYGRLTILYISSFFISGSIQFAYYFKSHGDISRIGNLFAVYTIGFMIWWMYMDRVYRFGMKPEPKYLILFSILNVILTPTLSITGAMLINSYDKIHHSWTIPIIYFGLAIMIIIFDIGTTTFSKGKADYCLSKVVKHQYIKQTVPTIICLLIFGFIGVWITLPIYILYLVVILNLFYLNLSSSWTVKHKIENSKAICEI